MNKKISYINAEVPGVNLSDSARNEAIECFKVELDGLSFSIDLTTGCWDEKTENLFIEAQKKANKKLMSNGWNQSLKYYPVSFEVIGDDL